MVVGTFWDLDEVEDSLAPVETIDHCKQSLEGLTARYIGHLVHESNADGGLSFRSTR